MRVRPSRSVPRASASSTGSPLMWVTTRACCRRSMLSRSRLMSSRSRFISSSAMSSTGSSPVTTRERSSRVSPSASSRVFIVRRMSLAGWARLPDNCEHPPLVGFERTVGRSLGERLYPDALVVAERGIPLPAPMAAHVPLVLPVHLAGLGDLRAVVIAAQCDDFHVLGRLAAGLALEAPACRAVERSVLHLRDALIRQEQQRVDQAHLVPPYLVGLPHVAAAVALLLS